VSNIRILVVDDHAIVREGLKALLELEKDISVVYEAASSMECLEMLDQCCPDVVLLDLKMPGIGGIDVVRLIKQNHPQIKVILLTNYDDEEYVLEAIKVEADGYVLKDVKKGDLIRIIRMVLEGRAFIDSSVMHKIFRHLKKPDVSKKSYSRPNLSHRELQILEYLVEGKSNKEIAEAVHLSLDTVKSHLKNIYQKLNVCNRSQAIKTAIKEGIIHLSH